MAAFSMTCWKFVALFRSHFRICYNVVWTVKMSNRQKMLNEMKIIKKSEEYIILYLDIREPLTTLRHLLEEKIGYKLDEFSLYLQDHLQIQEDQTLVDLVVQHDGPVQIHVQLLTDEKGKRINILDILNTDEDDIGEVSPERDNDETSSELLKWLDEYTSSNHEINAPPTEAMVTSDEQFPPPPTTTDGDEGYYILDMDILDPLTTLQPLLEEAVGGGFDDLSLYFEDCLQVEENKTVMDLLIGDEGPVQVNFQLITDVKENQHS